MVKGRRLCLLPIAGMKHYEGKDLRLDQGTPLKLRLQPENPYDGFAVEVFHGETKLGYVPKTHSQIFHQLIDAGVDISAVISKPIPIGYQMSLIVEVDDGKEKDF